MEDLIVQVEVDLEDIYEGTLKKIEIERKVICKKCEGKGGKNIVTCQ